MVFYHIIDIEKEFELLNRLLKKDGQVMIVNLDEEDSFKEDCYSNNKG